MRTFVEMYVFNDEARGQINVFYTEENRCKSERGVSGREEERERERKGQECVR
jgi:hypothetical protein